MKTVFLFLCLIFFSCILSSKDSSPDPEMMSKLGLTPEASEYSYDHSLIKLQSSITRISKLEIKGYEKKIESAVVEKNQTQLQIDAYTENPPQRLFDKKNSYDSILASNRCKLDSVSSVLQQMKEIRSIVFQKDHERNFKKKSFFEDSLRSNCSEVERVLDSWEKEDEKWKDHFSNYYLIPPPDVPQDSIRFYMNFLKAIRLVFCLSDSF